MDELIVRSLQHRTTLEEEQLLRAWRREHADHERHYGALKALWAITAAAESKDRSRLPTAAEILAAGVSAEVTPNDSDRRPGWWSKWRRHTTAGLIAAGVAGIALVVGVLYSTSQRGGALAEGEIVTGPGEMTTVTLSDQSSIRLGPESRLRLSQTRDRRIAYLEGRALFGIESNPARPFIVMTEHGEARVLGTRFEVNTNEDQFTVLVVEGNVSVSAGGAEIDLAEGELSTSVGGGTPVAVRVPDVYERIGWIGGAIVLQSTPLSAAVLEIQRRFGVDVEVLDPELDRVLITAAFTGQTGQEVMMVVCATIGASCSFEGSRVVVSPLRP
jgi:transmembrane sensor